MPRPPPRISPRNQRSPHERDARSQAVQRVAEQALLRGSLVRTQRSCGKKNCHCQQGQKHHALCLAIRVGNQRKMIYVPPALEETVRRWVETGQEVDGHEFFRQSEALLPPDELPEGTDADVHLLTALGGPDRENEHPGRLLPERRARLPRRLDAEGRLDFRPTEGVLLVFAGFALLALELL